MPDFDVLKSMPIRGRQLLIGVVLAPTIALLGVTLYLIVVALERRLVRTPS